MGDPDSSYLARGFRDIDRQPTVGRFVNCLSIIDSLSTFQEYKNQIIERLAINPGAQVIDVGCGLGFDVDRMSSLVGRTGRAVGVDTSEQFLAIAKKRAIDSGIQAEYVRADAHQLPFNDHTFDCCRIDRTLQHLEQPFLVIKEMMRVTKPSGRIVAAEPDWDTFTIADEDRRMVRAVVRAWGDNFKNGWIGRFLLQLFRNAGMSSYLKSHLILLEGVDVIDKVFDLRRTVELVARSKPEIRRWMERIQHADKVYPVSATVTMFIVVGTLE